MVGVCRGKGAVRFEKSRPEQYSDCAEEVCGNGSKPSKGPEVASMGVTFAGIASVSEYNLWSPTTNAQKD